MRRVIPEADLEGFSPPCMVFRPGCTPADSELIRRIRASLVAAGALDGAALISIAQDVEELSAVIKRAQEAALTEKDFAPELYDADLDEELSQVPHTETNQLLDTCDVGHVDLPLLDI